MKIFYEENGRLNGYFNPPDPISEAEFIQWRKQIIEELEEVSENNDAQPKWYV